MKEHLSPEQLAIYAEFLQEENLEKVPQEITQHIEDCDICASEAVELSFILDENKVSEKTNIIEMQTIKNDNKTIEMSPMKRYLAIAVSLILPLAIIFSYNYFKNNNQDNFADNNDKKQIVDTVKNQEIKDTSKIKVIDTTENKIIPNENNKIIIPKNNNLLAYTPHPETEKLVDNFKANMRGDDIEIITKKDIKVTENKKVTLKWQNIENIELTVEIFDNKGTNIISENTTESEFTTNTKLKKGLYYWKLFNEEFDLLFCGKIIVK